MTLNHAWMEELQSDALVKRKKKRRFGSTISKIQSRLAVALRMWSIVKPRIDLDHVATPVFLSGYATPFHSSFLCEELKSNRETKGHVATTNGWARRWDYKNYLDRSIDRCEDPTSNDPTTYCVSHRSHSTFLVAKSFSFYPRIWIESWATEKIALSSAKKV